MPAKLKSVIDKLIEKFISRKLLVWIVSTVALFLGVIDPSTWMAISLGYIGTHMVTDIASQWISAIKGLRKED